MHLGNLIAQDIEHEEQIVEIERKPLDEMTFEELIETFKGIIKQRSDPEQCYFYIDDDKQIRLDKLIGLPNTFERSNQELTDAERIEKAKREALE